MAASLVLTPDSILSEMAGLWVTLGKQGEPETGMGVLRACSMTLVVVAEESDDFQALGETIAALMPEHPARAIVIRLLRAAGPQLAGRVFAQCWMPFGQRRQICCEQIEITASEPALEDAAALLTAVAAPDLPVIAWCRSPRLLEGAEFQRLPALATRVVVDSARLPDAKAAIGRLAVMVAQGIAIGDLSWTRLTRWREMLSQLFENRERLAGLPAAVRARVAFGGKIAPASALYMAAWLADCLKVAGTSVTLSLEADSSAPEGQLERVELMGDGLSIELAHGDGRLRLVVDGQRHCASLPPATDYFLMREELGIVSRDPIFERTLASASAL